MASWSARRSVLRSLSRGADDDPDSRCAAASSPRSTCCQTGTTLLPGGGVSTSRCSRAVRQAPGAFHGRNGLHRRAARPELERHDRLRSTATRRRATNRWPGVLQPGVDGYFDTLGVAIVEGRAIRPKTSRASALGGRQRDHGAEILARPKRHRGDRTVGSGRHAWSASRPTASTAALTNSRRLPLVPTIPVLPPRRPAAGANAGEPGCGHSLVQQAVRQLDANLPLFDVRTMEEHSS